jgi:Fe-S-cluster-containing dehydrogenase component
LIEVDVETCNGCGICVEACKFDSIHLHPTQNIPMVCHLCGGKPQCVRYCMNGTLVFVTPEEYREVRRGSGKKEGEPKWPTHTHSV